MFRKVPSQFINSPIVTRALTIRTLNSIPATETLDKGQSVGTDLFGNELTKDYSHLQSQEVASLGSVIAPEPFSIQVQTRLSEMVNPDDVEVKPDGIIYVPEIKYRKKLNEAFGPGGWAMIPMSPHSIVGRKISREYALHCLGRYVSQARGEQDFFADDGIPTATEGCKSNALMRCCKDLGIYWQLWDPRFIRVFKAQHSIMVQGVHFKTQATKWLWRRKDAELGYPYKEK